MEKEWKNDIEKLEKVILSCRTKDHIKGAYNYYKLWQKKYKYYILDNPTSNIFQHENSRSLGLLRGMLEFVQ